MRTMLVSLGIALSAVFSIAVAQPRLSALQTGEVAALRGGFFPECTVWTITSTCGGCENTNGNGSRCTSSGTRFECLPLIADFCAQCGGTSQLTDCGGDLSFYQGDPDCANARTGYFPNGCPRRKESGALAELFCEKPDCEEP